MRLGVQFMNLYRGGLATDNYNRIFENSPTIEEILQDPSTADQIAICNQTLINYLNPDLIHQLIVYITKEPDPSESSQRIHKFPFLSAEFFNTEFGKMLDVIFDEKDLLEQLFAFIRTDEPVNFLLAGYFSKAFEALLMRNEKEFFEFFFQGNYHNDLVSHVYCPSISELTYKVLSTSYNYQQEKSEIVDRLIQKLGADYNLVVPVNAQSILVRALNENSMGINHICSGEIIDSLFNNLDTNNNEVLKASAKVLKGILQAFKYEEGVVERFGAHFDKIIKILDTPTIKNTQNTLRCQVSIIGEAKLLMFEIVNVLCVMSSDFIAYQIVTMQIIPKLANLFIESD